MIRRNILAACALTIGVVCAIPNTARGQTPASAALVNLPVKLPAERILSDLTRTALHEPATMKTWTEIARTLHELRPPAARAAAYSEAELAALDVVDAIARTTPGAIRELRVLPVGPHTEIVVRTTGEVPYRLFQSLNSATDPRLSLVLSEASSALIETDFEGIDRGGVRGIQVSEVGDDAIQIRVGLEGSTAFTVFRRGDGIVLRIENPGDHFAPWSSRPEPAGAPVRAPMPGSINIARSQDGEPAPALGADSGGEISALPAVSSATAMSSMASAGATRATIANFARGSASYIGRAFTGRGVIALGVALSLVLLVGVIRVIPRWVSARTIQAHPKNTRPKDRRLKPARTSTPRQSASRIWVARTLAENGATADEIARQTGLAQDAILLIVPLAHEPEHPAESAGAGSFYPGQTTPAGRAAARAYSVTH